MDVRFDKNIKLVGIGMVPWGRLGPEQWLPSYAIASLHGWDVPASFGPPVFALSDAVDTLPALPRINTASLLQTPEFQALLDRELPGYDLLTYKPVDIPEALASRKFLTAAPSYTATVENKAVFRQDFASIVTFPDYTVLDRAELTPDAEGYRKATADKTKIIIQDEQLSGGKGSFIVTDYQAYLTSIKALNELSKHERVVISSLVEDAQELSLQCCVTAYGVFVGPLQRQIVNHPELASQAVGGDRFCGVQVAHADQSTQLQRAARQMALQIGDKLQSDGYKGIFGVDYLLDTTGKLYVLEVNARVTGATPLLTALYDLGAGIPFYLLHLLELGSYPYAIDDEPTDFRREGSLLMVHSLEATTTEIVSMPPSGSYRMRNGGLWRTGDSVHLRDLAAGEFVIQEYMPPGMKIKPGGRLAVLQFAKPALSEAGSIYGELLDIVRVLRSKIKLKLVDN